MSDTFSLIAAERRKLADLLGTLGDEQWSTPSLCDGWTVREVAAHLTMPFVVGVPRLLVGLVRYRGNFDRLSRDWARRAAEGPTSGLVSTLRANAEHRFTPPGLGPGAPLTDIVVHGLDIRVPLGTNGDGPAPEALDGALAFTMTAKATRGFLPKGRVRGLRFEATDTGWSSGDGPTVRGPAAALVLALTGRAAGIGQLDGDGVAEFRRRLGA